MLFRVIFPLLYLNDTSTPEIYPLSLHDALPICSQFGAGLKSILGGELKGMTKALVDSREEVTRRMVEEAEAKGANAIVAIDRKSTRLNSSHLGISYAVFCLKKKKKNDIQQEKET